MGYGSGQGYCDCGDDKAWWNPTGCMSHEAPGQRAPPPGIVDRHESDAQPPLAAGVIVEDFPTEGITIRGISLFIEAHGGEWAFASALSDYSREKGLPPGKTSDICDVFFKPATVDQQESYCVAFRNEKPHGDQIGKATVFVSHAWGHQFLDVVAALRAYQSTQPEKIYFWFDIFSNNQHKTKSRDFTWWQTVFRDNIGRLKKTLLVLEWEDPKPLGRAWCLWEMVSTVNTKSDFQVLISPANQETFFARSPKRRRKYYAEDLQCGFAPRQGLQ